MKYRNTKVVSLLSGDREREREDRLQPEDTGFCSAKEDRLQPEETGFCSAKGLYIYPSFKRFRLSHVPVSLLPDVSSALPL